MKLTPVLLDTTSVSEYNLTVNRVISCPLTENEFVFAKTWKGFRMIKKTYELPLNAKLVEKTLNKIYNVPCWIDRTTIEHLDRIEEKIIFSYRGEVFYLCIQSIENIVNFVITKKEDITLETTMQYTLSEELRDGIEYTHIDCLLESNFLDDAKAADISDYCFKCISNFLFEEFSAGEAQGDEVATFEFNTAASV